MAIAAAAVTAAALYSRLLPLLPRRRRPSLGRARCRQWDGSPPCSPCSALAPAQPPPRALAWTEPTRRAARRASAGGGGPRDDPGDAPGRQSRQRLARVLSWTLLAPLHSGDICMYLLACTSSVFMIVCVFPGSAFTPPKRIQNRKPFQIGHNPSLDTNASTTALAAPHPTNTRTTPPPLFKSLGGDVCVIHAPKRCPATICTDFQCRLCDTHRLSSSQLLPPPPPPPPPPLLAGFCLLLLSLMCLRCYC